MPLSSNVELNQNGLVITARDLASGAVKPLDVAINDASGNQLSGFDPSRPASAVLTQPSVTGASSVILAANPARRGFSIFNDSGKKAFVALAATGASTTNFSFTLASGGFYESPADSYVGAVSAVVGSGTI